MKIKHEISIQGKGSTMTLAQLREMVEALSEAPNDASVKVEGYKEHSQMDWDPAKITVSWED